MCVVVPALPSRAVCFAAHIGMSTSAALSKRPSPIIYCVLLVFVPVHIGLAEGDFRSKAVCCRATSLISMLGILLPRATGMLNDAGPFMVVALLRTALNESALRHTLSTLNLTELTLEEST